jgi:hypothetical protein
VESSLPTESDEEEVNTDKDMGWGGWGRWGKVTDDYASAEYLYSQRLLSDDHETDDWIPCCHVQMVSTHRLFSLQN